MKLFFFLYFRFVICNVHLNCGENINNVILHIIIHKILKNEDFDKKNVNNHKIIPTHYLFVT